MANPKDVLVLTTSVAEGLKIKKYLKPISSHIVAGTNLFSDFLGGLTDVFGGRSETYQKQLISLYNEAIGRIKIAAYEIGANCVIGLNIDMDEISGKGKSMFMLTAIGTAVIIEKTHEEKIYLPASNGKLENVGIERLNALKRKWEIIDQSNAGNLTLNEATWSFIISNQIHEVFPYLLVKFEEATRDEMNPGRAPSFYRSLVALIEALPEDSKWKLLYDSIATERNELIALKLSEIINELNLFDFNSNMEILNNSDFTIRKRGVRIATYDKPFYNKQDKIDIQTMSDYIRDNFGERGIRTTKKQLLSSKEKEAWICECGKTIDIGVNCNACYKDIYGFKESEIKPSNAQNIMKQKIELISEYLE